MLTRLLIAIAFVSVVSAASAEETLFKDDFKGKMDSGWKILREDPKTLLVTDNGLEIRIEPGNMWGGDNNAKNVLVHPLPAVKDGPVSASVIVSNKPTAQYEQVDLVWYFDDSNMVKIGLELVDGQLTLVMGREEKDSTKTLAKIPITATVQQLRLTVDGNHIKGAYRPDAKGEWLPASACELPAKGEAKISLQAYQGAADVEHWAKITNFEITK